MIKAQQKSSLEFNGYSFLVNQTNVHQTITTKLIDDQRILANLNSLFEYSFTQHHTILQFMTSTDIYRQTLSKMYYSVGTRLSFFFLGIKVRILKSQRQ